MKKLALLIFTIIPLLSYSCAPTYHPVYPEPVNINTIIKPGESVKITTKDEKEYEFEVVEITDDAIVGETEKVLFTDIYKLQEITEKETFRERIDKFLGNDGEAGVNIRGY